MTRASLVLRPNITATSVDLLLVACLKRRPSSRAGYNAEKHKIRLSFQRCNQYKHSKKKSAF